MKFPRIFVLNAKVDFHQTKRRLHRRQLFSHQFVVLARIFVLWRVFLQIKHAYDLIFFDLRLLKRLSEFL